MASSSHVQGLVLDRMIREGTTLHLFTTNGFRVNGKIIAMDQYTVLVEDSETGVQNLVYKHAISTIALPKGWKFAFDPNRDQSMQSA